MMFQLFFRIICIAFLWTSVSHATPHSPSFYRNFWNPTYHVQRLNYCMPDRKTCGLEVATAYCRMMGYERADRALIDYHVGLTHFFSSQARCKGWQCNGFTLIRCVSQFSHRPPESYYYRSQRFVYPRFDHARVDWCYAQNQGCGQRAAYSFCRRIGYERAQSYKKEAHVPATKALGNHKLCFGSTCNGFYEITCYR